MRVKGYPFEVLLPSELPVNGVILADQVKSLDWSSQKAEFKAKAPDAVLHETLQKVAALLGFGD
jgi:mRNA interferase MazF